MSKYHNRWFWFSFSVALFDIVLMNVLLHFDSPAGWMFLGCGIMAGVGAFSHYKLGKLCTKKANCGHHKEGDFNDSKG